MNWKSLFTSPVKKMDAEQAKEYMKGHRAGEFQLLDVRQPKEYEKEHLAGAKLIPIKELADRLDELDKDKPIIAY